MCGLFVCFPSLLHLLQPSVLHCTLCSQQSRHVPGNRLCAPSGGCAVRVKELGAELWDLSRKHEEISGVLEAER